MRASNCKSSIFMASALGFVVFALCDTNLNATEFKEDFKDPTAIGGWKGGEVVSDMGHNDNSSLKVDLLSKKNVTLDGLTLDDKATVFWLDMYIRTPKTEAPIVIELSNDGYLCVMGLGRLSLRHGQGYGTRSSRGSKRSTWPRYHEVTHNIYTGENNVAKTETWVRLTARIDFGKKSFDVYRDGKLSFCEMETWNGSKNSRKVKLKISKGRDGDSTDSTFYIDDIYLGTKKPAGLEKIPYYPEKPQNLVARFAVVGDTQIKNGIKAANMFSVLGRAVPAINKLKPDLVFFVGDLIFLKDADKSREKAFCASTYAAWKKQAADLKCPYFPIRGNHDPLTYYREMMKKEEDFIVDFKGYTFICYSSACPDDVGGWNHMGKISEPQLEWMEREMAKAKAKGNRIFVLTHITSMANKSPLTGWSVVEGKDRLEGLYKKYGVIAEISGHMHRWLVNKYIDGVWYIVVPTIMEGGGMQKGHGIMVYDILPDKMLQYEKIVKGGYTTSWGKWAKHEIPIKAVEKK